MKVIQTLTLVHKSFYSHSRKSSSGTHKRCVLHFQWLQQNFNYSSRLAYSCSSLSLSGRLLTQMHTPLTVMFGALIRALPGNMQLVGEKVQNLTSKSISDTMDCYCNIITLQLKSFTIKSLVKNSLNDFWQLGATKLSTPQWHVIICIYTSFQHSVIIIHLELRLWPDTKYSLSFSSLLLNRLWRKSTSLTS